MKTPTAFLLALSVFVILGFAALAYPHGGAGHDNGNGHNNGHGHGHHHHGDGDDDECADQHPFDIVEQGEGTEKIILWLENGQTRRRYALTLVKGQRLHIYNTMRRVDFLHSDGRYRRVFFNPQEVEIGRDLTKHPGFTPLGGR